MEEKEINDSVENSRTITELDSTSDVKNMRKVEAALFISGRWMSMKELVSLTDVNPVLLRNVVESLIEKYASEESSIHIMTKDNEWKMDVKQEHMDMVNKLATGSSEFSDAEKETLAIIAYKQPVKQSVIVKIRGNKAYEHIKNFVNLGLLKTKRVGHTHELNLSQEFYEYFHVGKKKKEIILNSDVNKEEILNSAQPTHPDGEEVNINNPKKSNLENKKEVVMDKIDDNSETN
ncbi:MAG: SMC-Scp complex subunit ScpB [Nanoarchaeota archaeon]|nr:SMC-Scp complex subunit ScpB [Nanoarchaeota archaeon]